MRLLWISSYKFLCGMFSVYLGCWIVWCVCLTLYKKLPKMFQITHFTLILTIRVWEFQLLYILVSTWYCQFGVCVFKFQHSNRYLVAPHCEQRQFLIPCFPICVPNCFLLPFRAGALLSSKTVAFFLRDKIDLRYTEVSSKVMWIYLQSPYPTRWFVDSIGESCFLT